MTEMERRVLFNKQAKLPAFSLGFPIDRIQLVLITPSRDTKIVESGKDLAMALDKQGDDYIIRKGWGIYPLILGYTSIEERELSDLTLVQRNTESGSVRAALRPKRFELLRKDPSNVKNIVTESTVGYDNTDMAVMSVEGLHVDVIGAMIASNLESIGEGKAANSLRQSGFKALKEVTRKVACTVLVTTNEEEKYQVFATYFANPAQLRKGETSYFRIGKTASKNEMFRVATDATRRLTALYERFATQYNLTDFGKVQGDIRIMNADKDAKRVPLNDGGSRHSILMKKVGKMTLEETKHFINGDGSEGRMDIYRSVNKLKTKQHPEGEFIRFGVGSDLINSVNADDALITGVDGQVKVIDTVANIYGLGNFKFSKNLMDGSGVFDISIGAILKEEGIVLHEGQGVQGRFPGVKGLFIPTPELLERTGLHAYFGEGAVKLDPSQHLEEGTFTFSVLQATRIELENEASVVSTQALVAMETPAQILRQLQMEATHMIHASLDDADLALQLLGEGQAENEEDISSNEIVSRIQQDSRCLEDGAFRRRYAKLISKMSEKLQYGAVLAKQVRMRHMITDPYAILVGLESAIKDGVVKFPESIPANAVLAAGADGLPRTGKAAATRFPLVSNYEPRLVEAIGLDVLAEEAAAYYRKYLAAGFFQGLVMFSAHDMVTEAMSGADFDGDTCLLIFNDLLVGSMKDYPMFLDYTAKKEEGGAYLPAEGGCPFSDPTPALRIEDVLGVWMPEVLKGRVKQVSKGTFLTWNMEFMEEDVQNHPAEVFFVWQQMAAAKTLRESKRADIGEWSNRTTIAQDILAEVRLELAHMYGLLETCEEGQRRDVQDRIAVLRQEEDELVELIKWLTNAVRWAIDEAKHGGAFKTELTSQLAVFLEKINPKEFDTFEDFVAVYGISTVRFFIGA